MGGVQRVKIHNLCLHIIIDKLLQLKTTHETQLISLSSSFVFKFFFIRVVLIDRNSGAKLIFIHYKQYVKESRIMKIELLKF